jgi:hypothetical protein
MFVPFYGASSAVLARPAAESAPEIEQRGLADAVATAAPDAKAAMRRSLSTPEAAA